MDEIMRVKKLRNGYEVEVCDPEVRKRNDQPSKNKVLVPYRSPWKSYAFTTEKEAIAFVTKALPKLQPEVDDFSSTFDKACGMD